MGLLRKVFGPSKEEVWGRLADEMGVDFDPGTFWSQGRITAGYGPWTLTLDTYTVSSGQSSVTYTRMRAPYVNADGFRFTVYRQGFFSSVAKLFGMQDVTVGHPDFDRDFVIKGTDEERLRALFRNPRVRELLEAQPEVYLTVKDDEGWFGASFPQGVDELYLQVAGVIKDRARLRSLFELFAEVLNTLCHIGSAYEDDPCLHL